MLSMYAGQARGELINLVGLNQRSAVGDIADRGERLAGEGRYAVLDRAGSGGRRDLHQQGFARIVIRAVARALVIDEVAVPGNTCVQNRRWRENVSSGNSRILAAILAVQSEIRNRRRGIEQRLVLNG